MMRLHSVIAALALVLASSAIVHAEDKPPASRERKKNESAAAERSSRPCAADLRKFCPEAKPGSPQAFQCLREHRGELSDACKARIPDRNQVAQAGRRGGMKGFMRACRADIDAHCKGVQPGGGRYITCLKQHESKLSEACKKALP